MATARHTAATAVSRVNLPAHGIPRSSRGMTAIVFSRLKLRRFDYSSSYSSSDKSFGFLKNYRLQLSDNC
jgi:hypothetical protein